jgi:hypothetical protein
MIEFDVDMGYLLECDELDKVVLNDEDGEYEPMEFILKDAATVGRGNLTAEQVREAIMSADRWRKPMGDTGMTNTHLIIRDDGWQAITDELNATVGVGTCRNKGFVDDGGWYFVCSECGCEFEYGDFACEFAEGHGLGSPKFCPNCGAMVVVE